MPLQVQEVKIPEQPAPSENAVIPFNFQQGTPSGNESEIGYSSLMCDGTDNDIILAATQIEENVEKQRASATSSSKAIIKNQITHPLMHFKWLAIQKQRHFDHPYSSKVNHKYSENTYY